MIERSPIDLGDVIKDIQVPAMGDVLFDLQDFHIEQKEKDLFAEKERQAWDKSVEARCDFQRHVRLTRRSSLFFISIWQKSIMGRTLTDIKSDDDMVPFFAIEMSALITDIIGHNLKEADWCLITTPKRRHTVKNFATRISEAMASILEIPFYEDVCSCHTRQRVNAVFSVNLVPKEHNVICFDDFVTTGQTLAAMKTAMEPFGKNMMFFAGINNKL